MHHKVYRKKLWVLPNGVFTCFISLRNKQRLSSYTALNDRFFVTQTDSVECGVRNVSLNKFRIIFRHVRKILCLSVSPSVFLSVRMEQLGSHWTAFYEIWYLCTFRKYVQKIQVSYTSDKNNGYFTWRPIHIFYRISLNSFRMRNVWDKIVQKI